MMNQADKYRAIVIDSAYTIKIEDVFVFNAGSGGGIVIANAGHITLEDVSVYGTGKGVGIGISIQEANVNLYNPDVEACFHGLRISGNQGVHLFGGHFERHAAYGIRFERGSFNTITGVKISTPNSQGAAIGFFDSSVKNTVIGSRLDAHTTGNAAYQDSAADQSNLLMQSYLNGQVSEGIRNQ
jgi:nitrous oxidase accessory protein NosD